MHHLSLCFRMHLADGGHLVVGAGGQVCWQVRRILAAYVDNQADAGISPLKLAGRVVSVVLAQHFDA